MRQLRAIVDTLRAVISWLRGRRLGWLAPLIFILLGFGGLLALAAAVPAVSPFVYLLF